MGNERNCHRAIVSLALQFYQGCSRMQQRIGCNLFPRSLKICTNGDLIWNHMHLIAKLLMEHWMGDMHCWCCHTSFESMDLYTRIACLLSHSCIRRRVPRSVLVACTTTSPPSRRNSSRGKLHNSCPQFRTEFPTWSILSKENVGGCRRTVRALVETMTNHMPWSRFVGLLFWVGGALSVCEHCHLQNRTHKSFSTPENFPSDLKYCGQYQDASCCTAEVARKWVWRRSCLARPACVLLSVCQSPSCAGDGSFSCWMLYKTRATIKEYFGWVWIRWEQKPSMNVCTLLREQVDVRWLPCL